MFETLKEITANKHNAKLSNLNLVQVLISFVESPLITTECKIPSNRPFFFPYSWPHSQEPLALIAAVLSWFLLHRTFQDCSLLWTRWSTGQLGCGGGYPNFEVILIRYRSLMCISFWLSLKCFGLRQLIQLLLTVSLELFSSVYYLLQDAQREVDSVIPLVYQFITRPQF